METQATTTIAAMTKRKVVEPWKWEEEQQVPGAANKPEADPAQASTGNATRAPLAPPPRLDSEEDNRLQPWQSLMDEIERESSLSPPGRDYFPCQDGFYAHSLAG
ncbi:hypothetical protein QBC33DRAFT_545739 [Phialemonium atrogriseum]|uniref:Uncharacterized protein n=1 Tax=Phialemonium atrogriseum TaxID=1093897 RepID=A0AAJ0FE00_9PEZI|nr:uncharacterized protein QBC33DRAFT_545739 [Phialemonium atrogriseum]KAK1765101.1 hypothetical protein QBC33DRAFT_545739 [Phialemonium atrogriseum]